MNGKLYHCGGPGLPPAGRLHTGSIRLTDFFFFRNYVCISPQYFFLKSTHSKPQHLLSLKQRLTSCKQSEFIAPDVRQIDRCQQTPVSPEHVDSV